MKKFIILFPITDFRISPAVLFTNLRIHAEAIFKPSGELFAVQITSINYFQEGKNLASDIAPLIELINPELYQSIYEACKAHAADKFAKILA